MIDNKIINWYRDHINCKCLLCWKIINVWVWHLLDTHLICEKQKWFKKWKQNIKYYHWLWWSRIYHIWSNMKWRCNNIWNTAYNRYWLKWISYDKSRNDFSIFYNDMWKSYDEHVKIYWEKNTTLDRIDCSKWYSKNNCRWATIKEQANNRSNSRPQRR